MFVVGPLQAVRRGQQGDQRGFPDKHREHLDGGKETKKNTTHQDTHTFIRVKSVKES